MYASGVDIESIHQPLLICHHGAGSCGLSFALMARAIRETNSNIGVISFEMRQHGRSPSTGLETSMNDGSIENLVQDFTQFVHALINYYRDERPDYSPYIYLLGHSLGGSVVTHFTQRQQMNPEALHSVIINGLILVDMVEGTALSGLSQTSSFLRQRPQSFLAIENAIRWSLRMGNCAGRRLEALRVAVPGLLYQTDDNLFKWTTNILESENLWHQWFEGLSKMFIECAPVPRLLILAEREHLDRPLTIATMQGQFQCVIARDAGHSIQEDQPDFVSNTVASFIDRTLPPVHTSTPNLVMR